MFYFQLRYADDNGLSELLNGDADSSPRAHGDVEMGVGRATSGTLKKPPADGGNGESVSSVVGMLQAQRDRYKERLAQVEHELQSQRHSIQHISNEKAQLESDNLNLYQKIRFLQSTVNSGSGSSGGMFANTLADAVG